MANPDYQSEGSTPIHFVGTGFHDLSPFSAHEIVVDGITCKTLEHAYQALRLKPGIERDEVLAARSPIEAWHRGQKYKHNLDIQIPDHNKYMFMERLCRIKLQQHDDIMQILLDTKDRELVKVSTTDYYWGTGADGTGENQLGKIWMKLRDEIQ